MLAIDLVAHTLLVFHTYLPVSLAIWWPIPYKCSTRTCVSDLIHLRLPSGVDHRRFRRSRTCVHVAHEEHIAVRVQHVIQVDLTRLERSLHTYMQYVTAGAMTDSQDHIDHLSFIYYLAHDVPFYHQRDVQAQVCTMLV